jgi:hypothetical protein
VSLHIFAHKIVDKESIVRHRCIDGRSKICKSNDNGGFSFDFQALKAYDLF